MEFNISLFSLDVLCFLVRGDEKWILIPHDLIHSSDSPLIRFLALKQLHPEFSWKEWQFGSPKQFANSSLFSWSKEKRREYFNWLSVELGVYHPDQWYKSATQANIHRNHGVSMLRRHYRSSPFAFISEMIPEKEWIPWKFQFTPRHFWTRLENVRWFLFSRFSILIPEGIYLISPQIFVDAPACKQYFRSSPTLCVSQTLPEFGWVMWHFPKLPHNFWDNQEQVATFIEYMARKFKSEGEKDWYFLSNAKVRQSGGRNLLERGGLKRFLPLIFPEHQWDLSTFLQTKKKAQKSWGRILQRIFPSSPLLEDYFHPSIENGELDLYVKDLSIAIEFQGEQHYNDVVIFSNYSLTDRDFEKRRNCLRNGMTLVLLPFWIETKVDVMKEGTSDLVNKCVQKLKTLLSQQRPDILVKDADVCAVLNS